MPNRMIRDGILESEAVLSLPVEARWLYVSILLSADDVGLFEATPFRLARRADIRREHAEKLVQMLADSDLIRLYEAEGKWFGFVPRFRQRLQIKRTRYPMPPLALMQDDSDALSKINDLGSKTTVVQQMDNGCTDAAQQMSTAAQPSEPEPEPEVKPIHPPAPKGERRAVVANPAFDRLWAIYPRKIAKPKALKAFVKIKPDEEMLRKMLLAVEEQSRGDQWRKDDGRFVPYLATWLNDGRWDDVIETGSRPGGSIFDGAL